MENNKDLGASRGLDVQNKLSGLQIEKQDNYQYGESFTLKIGFINDVTRPYVSVNLTELEYNSIKKFATDIKQHGQFNQDETCIIDLV